MIADIGLIALSIAFAFSLYAYGTAYASVPIFFSLSMAVLLYYKRATRSTVAMGLVIFAMLALPIFLFRWSRRRCRG